MCSGSFLKSIHIGCFTPCMPASPSYVTLWPTYDPRGLCHASSPLETPPSLTSTHGELYHLPFVLSLLCSRVLTSISLYQLGLDSPTFAMCCWLCVQYIQPVYIIHLHSYMYVGVSLPLFRLCYCCSLYKTWFSSTA